MATSSWGMRDTAGERPNEARGVLDRALGLFADVRGGEGATAVVLMLDIFVLLAAYYLLKTIREPLILSVPGGAEIKSYSAAATAGTLLVLVPAYGAIAARVSRVKLLNGVTAFFVACLVAFFALSQAGVSVGVPFFIWVGVFNLVVIAQLWAFANDVYTVEQGKRLFAIVGFGAALGAIAGSFATGQLVKRWGPTPFMLGAAVLLVVSMVLTNVVHRRERHGAARATADGPAAGGPPDAPAKAGEPARDTQAPPASVGRRAFALVFSDRYLLLIAMLMLVYNIVNTNGEYILGRTVVSAWTAAHPGVAAGSLDEKKVIGEFYGNFFTFVNVLTALLQAFVVSRVLKYLGVRTALLVLPLVSLIGYVSLAAFPLLAFVRGVKLAENSLDYSLQNTTRNALYLPTSRDAKYTAKQANDTFFVRFGDVLSAGMVFAGTTWLGFAPRQFAILNAVLVVLWLAVAVFVGRRFRRLSGTQ